jgi:agmatinase
MAFRHPDSGNALQFRPQCDCGGDPGLTALRLMISDDVALESRDDTHVVVVNTASAARVKLTFSAYRFLKAFESPRRIDQVVPDGAAARVDKQILVDADSPTSADPARLRTAVAYKFCGAPAYARSTAPDFLILGIPYDLAGDIDSRLAPALIRQKSLDYSYQLEFGDGRPRGWFDVNRGAWILRGATLADAGDVPVDYGEDQARFFERVGGALAECRAGRSVPVILGGDRSATRAALGGLRHDGQLTVVQITAEPERAAAEGAGHHLSRMDNVERIVSLGAGHDDPGGLRERGPEAIVRAWGDSLSVYLSIDLGLATAARMKAAADGRPTGLTLHELKLVIAAIGKFHRIVGIDLVGLDMRSRSPELTAIIGCHLALAAMGAAYDRP